jgi:hypothetical protein
MAIFPKSLYQLTQYGLLLFASLLTACQSFLSPQSSCPKEANTVLKNQNVKEIKLDEKPQKVSGYISNNEAAGYTFSAKEGQQLNYKTDDNLCLWIYTPNQKILKETTLPENGIYLLQLTTPKGSSSYNITLNLQQPSQTLPTSTASPEPSPNSTNVSQPSLSPSETVEEYFGLVNRREYRKAWDILSRSQQEDSKLHPNGISSYQEWWDSVEKVELTILSEQKDEFDPVINAELTFVMKSGSHNRQKLSFFLIKQGDQWKINKAKLIQ